MHALRMKSKCTALWAAIGLQSSGIAHSREHAGYNQSEVERGYMQSSACKLQSEYNHVEYTINVLHLAIFECSNGRVDKQ